jgi:hypothetical protein
MTKHQRRRPRGEIPPLPSPASVPPRTRIGRWLSDGAGPGHAVEERPWYEVLWLTGVDYFSTLGYQPGIALLAAGALSPLATLLLIAVTLGGALPVYSQVAKRSFVGQGSIAILEKLLRGWWSKLFVLVLLGFAATDFVITMTLSASDAAQHVIENPYFPGAASDGARLLIALVLLALLAIVFLRGFREAIGLAMTAAIPYLLLNLIVAGRGLVEIWRHPDLVASWKLALSQFGSWKGTLLVAALTFPRLALGLSGFETGVSVMPHVEGLSDETTATSGSGRTGPAGRIAATRRLLTTAAIIMSVLLAVTSFVTAVLVPRSAYQEGGPAAGRTLSWLAHEQMGSGFGTIYDVSTILILWFAGASALAGLLNLIPRYLPRFGMAPHWVEHRRPLVVLLFVIAALVTTTFGADVESQGGAYATGVLALMLSAAIAIALAFWRERAEGSAGRRGVASGYFWLVSAVFAYTFVDNVIERPSGVFIAAAFILATVGLSAVSRWRRAMELRVERIVFDDRTSEDLWPRLVGKKVNLVPLKHFISSSASWKENEIRRYYKVSGPIAFLHVRLADDRSEFSTDLRLKVRTERENFFIEVSGAVAVANSIAYMSELLDPVSIFLGLTRRNRMSQALRFLLFGEGETGIRVYHILLEYWEWTPEEDVRPLIFLMSE